MTLNNIGKLKTQANKFDSNSQSEKHELLSVISKSNLPLKHKLIQYYDLLLFLSVYADSASLLSLVEKELIRISMFLKKQNVKSKYAYVNSGMPNTLSNATYSHDTLSWLSKQEDCKLMFHSFEHKSTDLNDVLKITLPSIERSEVTRGYSNEELLDSLLVENTLEFLLSELSKLNHEPLVKDHLFNNMGVAVDIIPKNKFFSKAFNCIPIDEYYFHQDLKKQFDHKQLFNKAVPAVKILSSKKGEHVVRVIKYSLALMERETDPVTFMDEGSLRLYELERGISIALYSKVPERQLPMESFVGYTLFKNGYPLAYGGSWIFGEHADFGINIFPSYRGGESGYVMCQLLRLYKQVFGISYFEIEPYQFGLDNPDGIRSGAFWFYYRYGFRPIDKALLKLANQEYKKIKSQQGYRTPFKTLEKFTQSSKALRFKNKTFLKVHDVTHRVTEMIANEYSDKRQTAVEDCIQYFKSKTGGLNRLNKHEKQVLEEVALWAKAFSIRSKNKLNLLKKMIKTKPVDQYAYQKLLLKLLK